MMALHVKLRGEQSFKQLGLRRNMNIYPKYHGSISGDVCSIQLKATHFMQEKSNVALQSKNHTQSFAVSTTKLHPDCMQGHAFSYAVQKVVD